MMLRRTTPADVKKIKNHRNQNFGGKANNMQLDKEDTQRSILNSKYLSVTLCQNNLILVNVFVLIMFNNFICKVRFDIAIR